MAAIHLDGLVKQFGDVRALDGVDLSVRDGEIFGFLGPNGAGKSTTIDVLLDFVRPTSGTATVLDMDAQAESTAIRARTGVLPEGYHLYDRLTGRQHVEFVRESKDLDVDPVAALERVGVADAVDRRAGGYSTGMKQRLMLGMALVGDPDVLILDEPSSGLDPAGVRDVREVVRDEAGDGTTVFFSSHILSQVEAVCDRVGILRGGRVVAVDTVAGLRDAVGTDATLRVTVEGDPDRVEAGVDAVREVAGVTSVGRAGADVVVRVEDRGKIEALHALEDAGLAIRDFETQEASLEELFLAYAEGDG